MTEFWPELLTVESWKKLQQLKRELKNFIVIGGWAIYLWTKMHKSKDIDIIIDYKILKKLKQEYELNKNPKLKKYEIKFDKFDIYIYLPHYSEFALPFNEIKNNTTKIQGFEVPKTEILLILKQTAEIQRKASIKGEKDAIDILTLLIKSPFNIATYKKLIKKNKIEFYVQELKRIINDFDAKKSSHVGLSFKEFHDWRKAIIKQL